MCTRILLLGGTGLLGRAIHRAAIDLGYAVIAPDRKGMDLLDPDAGRNFLNCLECFIKLDVVINCAGISNPDFVKDRLDLVTVNVLRPIEFANMCGNRGIKYVHMRSCFEQNPPTNDYTRSKVTAYHALKMMDKNHIYYIMLGWLFGDESKHRVGQKIIEAAMGGRDFRATHDRAISPTYSVDAAKEILRLIACAVPGEYTVANRGAVTFAEVARVAWNVLRAKGILIPVKSNDEISRPHDCTVDGNMRDWKIAWTEYLELVKKRGGVK